MWEFRFAYAYTQTLEFCALGGSLWGVTNVGWRFAEACADDACTNNRVPPGSVFWRRADIMCLAALNPVR